LRGRRWRAGGLPVIGNNVVLGARAVVLGPVRIGDNATIGACALVMKDMGEGQIAVGPQARVLPRLGPRIDYEALAGLKQPTGN
jgi:serine O-acetyltransferase